MTPDAYTIQETFLDVGDGHTLYVHEWGNKNAKVPILLILGGPGSSLKDKHKRLFNPRKQRVIFFDQRGCGKSQPYGSLENNTTQKLVEDIEKIAESLSLSSFIITGGSWGSCLALAYAIKYSHRVNAMVLDGIFTGSKEEIDWLETGRFKTFYPDVWEAYLAATPAENQADPGSYHYKQIMSDDAEVVRKSGQAYENLEGAIMSLDDRFYPEPQEEYDPAAIRLEMHYMNQGCFLPDNYIIENAHALTMPIWLVQGRYDMVCPPAIAYKLHKTLPNSELVWTISGHASERESWNIRRVLLAQLSSTYTK